MPVSKPGALQGGEPEAGGVLVVSRGTLSRAAWLAREAEGLSEVNLIALSSRLFGRMGLRAEAPSRSDSLLSFRPESLIGRAWGAGVARPGGHEVEGGEVGAAEGPGLGAVGACSTWNIWRGQRRRLEEGSGKFALTGDNRRGIAAPAGSGLRQTAPNGTQSARRSGVNEREAAQSEGGPGTERKGVGQAPRHNRARRPTTGEWQGGCGATDADA